jgi:pimeloyl-ACP methyl ester carboxylesterase
MYGRVMGNRGSFLVFVLSAAWAVSPRLAVAQAQESVPSAPQIDSKFAEANGVKLHYLVTGQGDPVLLLHGFGQSSQMWRPLMRELARNHTVIAADLRGAGQSDAPPEGYTKAEMARDMHALMTQLGYSKVSVVGHDIGMMVTYAYAAQFPNDVQKIVLLEALLPGIGEWQRAWPRDQWHMHFYGKTPEALVQGRERIYLEHFWNDFAADPAKTIPEADRKVYAAEYARPNHVRAGMEWFRVLNEDAKEFHEYAAKPLTVPMLVLAGEKGSGEALVKQAQLIGTDVQGAFVPGAGHWLLEEAPGYVIPKIVEFLGQQPDAPSGE